EPPRRHFHVLATYAARRAWSWRALATTTASTSGAGANRNRSAGGSPASRDAASHARRASASVMSYVLSEMPMTLVGCTAEPIVSYSRTYSVSGGILSHAA